MTDWYYARNGQQQGPVTLETLQQLARTGQLDPSADLVWNASMTDWIPAGQAAGVFVAEAPAGAAPGGLNPYAAPRSMMPEGQMADESFRSYAGFGWRFLAALIDSVVTAIVGFIAGAVLGVSMAAAGETDEASLQLAGQALGILIGWLYYASMESSSLQGTLGKAAVGIKVTDLHGQRIGFARASGRHFAKIISALILLVGYLMCLFTEKKQCLHDLMAGCLVVRK
jgi:uncharacterized RDD family membrane protein YckC